MSVTLDCTSAPFVQCGKFDVLMVATVVAWNANEALVVSGGSPESGGRFCVDAFGKNLAYEPWSFFLHLNYIKKYFKFGTSSAICEDNVAINCITLKRKEGSIPSTLTGHTTLVHLHRLDPLDVRGGQW
jgi:hypothetical protein